MKKVESHILPREKQKQFLFAGKSFFTVVNPKTKNRFSFKVRAKKDKLSDQFGYSFWFVSANTNRDNEHLYNYIGYIKKQNNQYTFYFGKKSKVSKDSDYVKVFTWLFRAILTNNPSLDLIEFYHNGYCGCCGKLLTVPKSIEDGFGPVCINKI